MEQQNFRVKFSLGTKLVLSLSFLFLLIVGLLSYFAITLVVKDKRDYASQIQSMQAMVISKDFAERVRPAIDDLRLYLTSFDPRLAITPAQQENLQNLVKSQRDVAYLESFLVKPDGTVTLLTKNIHPELVAKLNLNVDQIQLDQAFFKRIRDKTVVSAYTFEGYFKKGMPPLLIVAFADVSLKDYDKGMPVGLAFLDANSGALLPNARLGETSIATPEGKLLASTDPNNLYDPAAALGHPVFQMAAAAKFSAGTKEFEENGVTYLGAFQKIPIGPIIFTQLDKKKVMQAAFDLGQKLAFISLISLIAAILFAVIFSGGIVKPLRALTSATAQVAKGDFSVKTKVATGDEVGLLANSFNLMSGKIQELVHEQVGKARLEEELKVAAAVQESLIPPPEYKDEQFEIVGSYESASECGGDWWGFFRVKNKLCVMIADATGHGVPSALITASARSCFSVLAKMAQENPSYRLKPGEMMSYTNRVVFDAAMTKIMMTFFIGIIDLETMTITYANAGHNPPWLFKKNGDKFVLKSLVPKGTRVGEREESGVYEEMSQPMSEGDILVLYTDGLMENTQTKGGEQFGKKRAREVAEKGLTGGPRGVIDSLKAAYRAYNGTEKALDDDVTLAAIRIHSSKIQSVSQAVPPPMGPPPLS